MGGACVAIDTPMLTAPVRIDACIETYVGAVVGCYNGMRCVLEKVSVGYGIPGVGLAVIGDKPKGFEPIGRVLTGTPAVDWRLFLFH